MNSREISSERNCPATSARGRDEQPRPAVEQRGGGPSNPASLFISSELFCIKAAQEAATVSEYDYFTWEWVLLHRSLAAIHGIRGEYLPPWKSGGKERRAERSSM
ncbi:hypothetical protein K0M31_003544 [Melipona bicolor]|uniref:Uncharacterized protein n=1 Tax=Melipona bicolor TaxID=60889 RepID=A0AA40G022_9HYME|nr:hypothetical protein K0M31_003544 [Melipona bicolor]